MNLPIPDNQGYIHARPFPHCIVDGAFYRDELAPILDSWPANHQQYGNNKNERMKGATFSEDLMGSMIADFIKINFQSQKFIGFLEALTGITGLVFDCKKFGLHEIFNGGYLNPHLDYSINRATGLQLRINVILYLNENWKPEYNGNLELYESIPAYGGTLSKAAVSIEPRFNRMAIFTMDAETPAWHGNPTPLNTPEGVSRKSIALNYFTIPQGSAVYQATTFSKTSIWKELLPPILYRLINK